MAQRIQVGAVIPPRTLTAVDGHEVRLPAADGITHLQLRRFAGCPVCNLHLQSVARRHDEIAHAGVTELVVFHSRDEELEPQVRDLPFAVVGDPQKHLYVELGAESSLRAMLDPRAWPAIARGLVRSMGLIVRRQGKAPALFPEGRRWGLPVDLLLTPSGEVLAAKYGAHADDQWSVDELLALVPPPSTEHPTHTTDPQEVLP
jgi:peroxiredoxin